MLDIKFIRENAEDVKEAIKNKNITIDIDELLSIDKKRRELQTKLDELRAKKNEIAAANKGGRPSEEQIEAGKKVKADIASCEEDFKETEKKYFQLMVKVPTIPSEDTPVGKSEDENVEIYAWGEKREFDFEPKSHIEIGKELGLFDFERGTKVAGYRGHYIMNEAVMLQVALMNYGLNKLVKKGFMPMIPPTLVREFALYGSGYFSGKEYDPEVDEIYKIENNELSEDGTPKKENKFLVGTSEPSILAYHSNEVLDKSVLPLRIGGFSQCYRSEIGSYGKDTKGIYRVHEFMKIEQVCICEADVEKANALHEEMVAISKEIHEELGLPYRQLAICTGDMSAGKYKMFDLEAWMPSKNAYGETGSASNFLDWQSRRLNVRYKDDDGKIKYVYMLNNTAIPSPRVLISILENYQQEDGSVVVPEVLRKYMGGVELIKKK